MLLLCSQLKYNRQPARLRGKFSNKSLGAKMGALKLGALSHSRHSPWIFGFVSQSDFTATYNRCAGGPQKMVSERSYRMGLTWLGNSVPWVGIKRNGLYIINIIIYCITWLYRWHGPLVFTGPVLLSRVILRGEFGRKRFWRQSLMEVWSDLIHMKAIR